ncbi:MAG: 30S ribosomal protein S3 [Candidatus Zambryskibacteria bacterium RIFCSPLOWO2_01_FULL_39_39]|uniref:Small ribosomal subunit protein uS3 n=2 Tax=root TaxID=1 RepID=A0A1G2TY19_9BACT|nr:30S ribosomal protein S3 [uncultured organism]KKQ77775.1 MAG: 30S ribosomal protein S3 [Parcubacteria group bacterium GW2011_GWA1_38_7]OHA87130.1 MAG: 30S ribosomal protein S3 [Candidatus Zambryskibacteria bacterium RIFCSPHIGHO2_01_FULL_39_63]OHA94671.1 MAG: 30S ribosomal protein S3 [Candidatus Zambryskibacteria bacterium RIFCSPHIGHO2_02_FULL_39_19]OHA98122.1 MAG: 30S ribosomal protein S3 [Candidatus Zambryskibacteria bacterium RIFCSPHIGHO2_12_FULL_39_21]OHB02134.1 MAG: 30S ribosomal protei
MTHTVHPYAHRLGIIRDWRSRWFGVKSKYKENLKGDVLIFEYLKKRLKGCFVNSTEIERSAKVFRIIIETSRPGFIIGRNGEGMNKLRDDIIRLMRRRKLSLKEELKIDVKEVKSPESSAMIAAQMIAEGLEKRMPFRRVIKTMIEKAYANRDVKGVKVTLSGIMGGSAMARVETKKVGRIPLQTLRADIDYALYEARLPLGKIGVKVWIYKGDIFDKDKSVKT